MHLPAAEKALDEQLCKAIPLIGFGLLLLTSIGLAKVIFALFPTDESQSNKRGETESFGLQKSSSSSSWPRDRSLGGPLKASDHVDDGKHHLLLAATGSVATIKIPNIVDDLVKYDNLSIRILLSQSASNFLQAQSGEQPSLRDIAKMKNVDGIYGDEDEWREPWVRGANILHIELRRWADLMVIAPLSANSLAKITLGISDNLINSVVRAWDATGMIDKARPGIPYPYGDKKGIIVAPAMNTAMWHHPLTAEHMKRLTDDWSTANGGWVEVLKPIVKDLACGDTGSGAMHDWRLIVATIEKRLGLSVAQPYNKNEYKKGD